MDLRQRPCLNVRVTKLVAGVGRRPASRRVSASRPTPPNVSRTVPDAVSTRVMSLGSFGENQLNSSTGFELVLSSTCNLSVFLITILPLPLADLLPSGFQEG